MSRKNLWYFIGLSFLAALVIPLLVGGLERSMHLADTLASRGLTLGMKLENWPPAGLDKH